MRDEACWEDKRVMRLYPTEKTQQLLPQIREIQDAWENCITRDLSEQEKVLLERALLRMKERASAWMADSD